jgi:hypothetical protein
MPAVRLLAVLGLLTALAGCILPPALTIASYAADGISLVVTGKTVTDHVLSAAADEDCRMWRLLQGDHICQTKPSALVAAKPPTTTTASHPVAIAIQPGRIVGLPPAPATPTPGASMRDAPVAAVGLALPGSGLRPGTIMTDTTELAAAPATPAPALQGPATVERVGAERIGSDQNEAEAERLNLRSAPATIRHIRPDDDATYEVGVGIPG